MKEQLLKLDKLREEKKELEYFIKGGGSFGITIDVTLFKCFGIGQHDLVITDRDTKALIFKILENRLVKINSEISKTLGLEE